ncbi:MAG: hypothetical protein CL918_08355 [Deltaproteobacteria bacterium]|nr:hypothetical protein [Deltaproteobacteria bacterium]
MSFSVIELGARVNFSANAQSASSFEFKLTVFQSLAILDTKVSAVSLSNVSPATSTRRSFA